MIRLYFEDFPEGSVAIGAPRTITREEIVRYAAAFDPQPFHLDEEAGRDSLLGGLSASGWHSCALTMRMMYDDFVHETASMGSPGVEEVRWLVPVRPDDVLRIRRAVLDARVSQSRPHMGIVRFRFEMLNAADTVVMTMVSAVMIGRRPWE